MQDLLTPVFQPIFPVQANRIYAFEAFLRVKGDVSNTARHVPRWERSKLIAAADIEMMRQIRGAIVRHNLTGRCRIAVNVSDVTIETRLKDLIAALVALGETCGAVIVDVPPSIAKMHSNRLTEFTRLANHNRIAVAYDDVRLDGPFLSQTIVSAAPPQYIKVDGGYLLGLTATEDYSAFSRFISRAKLNGIRVMVKNCDAMRMRNASTLAGADFLQGNLMMEPLPLELILARTVGRAAASSNQGSASSSVRQASNILRTGVRRLRSFFGGQSVRGHQRAA